MVLILIEQCHEPTLYPISVPIVFPMRLWGQYWWEALLTCRQYVGYLTLSCSVLNRNWLLLSSSEDKFLLLDAHHKNATRVLVAIPCDVCMIDDSITFGQRKIHKNQELRGSESFGITYIRAGT